MSATTPTSVILILATIVWIVWRQLRPAPDSP
jgi:hypothetical protein